MSLGLGDLDKKRRSKANRVVSTAGAGSVAAGTPSVKPGFVTSKTARPWSNTDLQRAPTRRRGDTIDAFVNDEWSSCCDQRTYADAARDATPLWRLSRLLTRLEESLQDGIQSAIASIAGVDQK